MGQIQSFVHNQAKCPATELKHPQLPGELFELGEMVAEELVFFLLLLFFFSPQMVTERCLFPTSV